jgi:hypothetical protein
MGNEPVETLDDRLQITLELGTESDEVGQPADRRRDSLERVRKDRDLDGAPFYL